MADRLMSSGVTTKRMDTNKKDVSIADRQKAPPTDSMARKTRKQFDWENGKRIEGQSVNSSIKLKTSTHRNFGQAAQRLQSMHLAKQPTNYGTKAADATDKFSIRDAPFNASLLIV